MKLEEKKVEISKDEEIRGTKGDKG